MNIWVTRFSESTETWITTHLTEKGALMHAIGQISDYIYGERDIDQATELKVLYGYPTSADEDLKHYAKSDLHKFYKVWSEEMKFSSNNMMEHEIHKTEVMV
tara:strand:- start:535 stop:840 length:306 start_codon:yes stop_codon:yes gene_type:complete